MNKFQHKPMPTGAKLVAYYAGRYWLSEEDAQSLEHRREYLDDFEAVDFIDERGEWLD